jgi:hypothetical protein
VFDQEVMCRYVPFARSGPFPEGLWQRGVDEHAKGVGDSVVCVEVSASRHRACIARAALSDEGLPVVGIWQARQGTDWVTQFLVENREKFTTIMLRATTGAPALSLMPDFAAAGLPITEWKGSDIGAAHGSLFDKVSDGTLKHLPHPALDAAATSAVPKMLAGGGWVVDQHKSPSDVSALLACIGAVWAVVTVPAMPAIY